MKKIQITSCSNKLILFPDAVIPYYSRGLYSIKNRYRLLQNSLKESKQKKRSASTYYLYVILINTIKTEYRLQNYNEIIRFLYRHKNLIIFLIEACQAIRKHFPSETITLKLVRELDGSEELIAHILTDLSVTEGLKKVNDIDEEWFLNQLHKADGLFNFNVKFV